MSELQTQDNWPKIVYEDEIRDYLARFTRGQDRAVKLLGFLGHMYTLELFGLKCDIRKRSMPKINALFTGPTGFGKTFLVRKFADSIAMPYKKIDCTSVNAEGWKGTSLSALLLQYLQFSPNGYGILHLDEVDKLGVTDPNYSEGKLQMQQALLDLLDGDYHHSYEQPGYKPVKLDKVNNALVIMTGSFQQHRDDLGKYRGIGFKSEDPEKTIDDTHWKEKIIELGFMHEFSSRIITSLELDRYTDEQIREIILNTEESAYTKYYKLFNHNAVLDTNDIDELVQAVQKNKNGLRELDALIFDKYYEKGVR